jgi:four helix bundle protein
MANLNSFQELECWKKARALRGKVRKCYMKFPADEKYLLIDQLKRSTRSVTANIAEGFGKFHYLENTKSCRISRGELCEIQDHLVTAFDEEYIDEATLNDFKKDINECLALLNGYINYLLSAKKKILIK